MRARLFQLARFAVYVAVISAGVYHLASRDDARGEAPEPPGEWVRGKTTQRLPVSIKVDDHRVIVVDATWRAECGSEITVVRTDGFMDAFDGDFERDGQSFKDEYEESNAGWGDQTAHLTARLQGEAAGGVARGSVDFTLDIHENGHVVQTCASGPVGFAVDLPG